MTALAAAGRVVQLVIGGADALVLGRQNAAALTSEVAARGAALTAETQARTSAIGDEAQARTAAIEAEAQARATAVSAEAQARADAIAAETAQREAERQGYADQLAQETASRVGADQGVADAAAGAVAREAQARADAVTAEARTRDAAVAALTAAQATAAAQVANMDARWRAAMALAAQRMAVIEQAIGPANLAAVALAHAAATAPARMPVGCSAPVFELPYSVSVYETLHLWVGGVEAQPGLDFEVYGNIVILQQTDGVTPETEITHYKTVGEATVATAAGMISAVTNPARFTPPAGSTVQLPYEMAAGETLHLWVGGVEQHPGLDYRVAGSIVTLLGDPLDGSTSVTHYKTALLAAGRPDGLLDFTDPANAALAGH